MVQVNPAIGQHSRKLDHRAVGLKVGPWGDVGVMIEVRQHDLIAGLKKVSNRPSHVECEGCHVRPEENVLRGRRDVVVVDAKGPRPIPPGYPLSVRADFAEVREVRLDDRGLR